VEEKMQIKVVERQQEISVQEQEILRRQKELDATIRRPAEAEKYRFVHRIIIIVNGFDFMFEPHNRLLIRSCSLRMEKIAEAHRNRVILEAEAEAEAIRIKGDAEAFALEAKGMAEAEQLARKAEAYRTYKDAAIVDLLLEALPKVRYFFWIVYKCLWKTLFTVDFYPDRLPLKSQHP
jgi:flotillin